VSVILNQNTLWDVGGFYRLGAAIDVNPTRLSCAVSASHQCPRAIIFFGSSGESFSSGRLAVPCRACGIGKVASPSEAIRDMMEKRLVITPGGSHHVARKSTNLYLYVAGLGSRGDALAHLWQASIRRTPIRRSIHSGSESNFALGRN